MSAVRIATVAVAHPDERVRQCDVPGLMGVRGLAALRVRAVVRGSHIHERRIVLPPDEIRELRTIEQRNRKYHRYAPGLATSAAAQVLEGHGSASIAGLVTTSCTGYSVPSLATHLAEDLKLPPAVTRLPITEAGCSGGVVALARAADLLRAGQGEAALAVAVELCSLSFHRSENEGVLTSNLIFGDGAGAALLRADDGPGLEIVDCASLLVPNTRHLLGFDLTDEGFLPVLERELVSVLPGATVRALAPLLARNGLSCDDIGAWLIHPGGSRILAKLEHELGLAAHQARWSWESLRDFGNTSSAAIFDVLRRYLEDIREPEWAVVAAFGPGISIELLLTRRTC